MQTQYLHHVLSVKFRYITTVTQPVVPGLYTGSWWDKVNQGVATSNRVRGVTTPENYSGSDTPIYDWNLNSMNVGGAGQ